MPAKQQRLYINIDHVATLRQARRADEPDPVAAALACEAAGADGITAHLREDRRHIQDADVLRLRESARYFNLELAAVPEMVQLAIGLKPQQVTLVPERREEITTEGGLDIVSNPARIQKAIDALSSSGIRVSLFIDPTAIAVEQSARLGVPAVELHTGTYAHDAASPGPLRALRESARLGSELGLAVHAGHGLTVGNVARVAAIPEIEELNIGHSIVSRSVFIGIENAVREMREAMRRARSS